MVQTERRTRGSCDARTVSAWERRIYNPFDTLESDNGRGG